VKNLSTRYLLVRDASTRDGIDFVVSGLTADDIEAAGEWLSTELTET
jgi:hypothetical protein